MLILIAVLAAVAVITSLLMPMPFYGRTSSAIGDMVHAPLFGCLAIGSIHLLSRWLARFHMLPSAVGIAVIALLLFAFGVAMEYAQSFASRSPSLHDALSNGLGILAGCCLYIAYRRRKLNPADRIVPRFLWGAAGFLIALVWWGPVGTLRDVRALEKDFPLLASFESKAELERWYFNQTEGRLTTTDATHGKRSLEVTFPVAEHPAVTLIDLKHDWSKLKTIEWDVVLDSDHSFETAEVWINVIDYSRADDYRDIFRKRFTLRRGEPTLLVISRDELLDPADGKRPVKLGRIEFIEMQMIQPTTETIVRADFLRLRM
ncbi:VanZ like family protein [Rubripirellula tenax]|uniref:VanZ like family protein n=1 Tax=Rubripirellula tenax TaxID=2528015 RepID=A0A5C6F4S6_9BACT|nr:hypothetical protein [Rubripirellula tenax]TWU54461.1 VanZ like family protein [Rubripirellula tenax]